jgi:NAD(P)-dependent dehydrogenase (short-subunit alcohol dehydrogenase family)
MPVAIVTGASKGLGRALAHRLAADGWVVIIDGRDPTVLARAHQELTSVGATVTAIAGDVTDVAHRSALIASATAVGALDLIVNNASSLGPTPLLPLAEYPLDEFRRVLEVNVVAPLALVQLALPLLRRSRGVVVGISSDAACEPYERWGGYGATKAALDQMHRVLAAEEPTLRVYALDPGDMRTDMHQAAFPGEDISDRPLPEAVVPAICRLVGSHAPSGRYRASEWTS